MRKYTCFEIECDECKKGLSDPLSDFVCVFRDTEEANDALQHEGWHTIGNRHICDDCWNKLETPSKELEPYEQRMIDEYNELGERWMKLGDFLTEEASGNSGNRVSRNEYVTMNRQFEVMKEYLQILERRMRLHGIKIGEPKEEQ